MKVTVIRAFLIKGVRQEPGSSIDVPESFGRELLHTGRVSVAEPSAPAASGPMTTDSAPAIVAGKKSTKAKD